MTTKIPICQECKEESKEIYEVTDSNGIKLLCFKCSPPVHKQSIGVNKPVIRK